MTTNVKNRSKLIVGGLSTTTSKVKTTEHRRVKSNSVLGVGGQVSRYAHIPTENLKFRSFIEALFGSKMTSDDIKEEVKAYVEVLETNYTDTIRDLKAQIDRL